MPVEEPIGKNRREWRAQSSAVQSLRTCGHCCIVVAVVMSYQSCVAVELARAAWRRVYATESHREQPAAALEYLHVGHLKTWMAFSCGILPVMPGMLTDESKRGSNNKKNRIEFIPWLSQESWSTRRGQLKARLQYRNLVQTASVT